MTDEELKNKCKERAKIFQQAMESCHSSSLMDCIEWFADRIAELEKENKTISRKANEAIADKLLITAKYNEVLNDLNQEKDMLQKKNAELEEENQRLSNLVASYMTGEEE